VWFRRSFLDLLPACYIHFIHGNILERANVHICSLLHTARILIVALGAVLEAEDFFGEGCVAGQRSVTCNSKLAASPLRDQHDFSVSAAGHNGGVRAPRFGERNI
jgi:hypothetical protein